MVGLLATGFVLGAVVTFGYMMTTVVRPLTRLTVELQRQAQEAKFVLAYRLSDYGATECNMNLYTQLTSVLLSHASDTERNAILRSLGLSYGRLAKAAEKAGRLQDHDRFLAVARITFHEVDPEVSTIKQVQEIVTHEDGALAVSSCSGHRD